MSSDNSGSNLQEGVPLKIYRHYTDEIGRRGITRAGVIGPGLDGRVYVTADEFGAAAEAEARLALPVLPTGYLEVPEDRLEGLSLPALVEPNPDHPGGGLSNTWSDQSRLLV